MKKCKSRPAKKAGAGKKPKGGAGPKKPKPMKVWEKY